MDFNDLVRYQQEINTAFSGRTGQDDKEKESG
jgi:hypothetical protein